MTALKELRERSGVDQVTIAKFIGVGQSCYSQYETGRSSIPVEVANKISKFFGVNRDDIFLPLSFTNRNISKIK